MELIATKELIYDTRRLLPGMPFTASDKDGKLLVAIKKAKQERVVGTIEAPSAKAAAKFADAAVNALRSEADALGATYDKRWGVDKLQTAIDAAKVSSAVAPVVPADDDTPAPAVTVAGTNGSLV